MGGIATLFNGYTKQFSPLEGLPSTKEKRKKNMSPPTSLILRLINTLALYYIMKEGTR